jgi:hypothetical protein
MLGEPLDNKKQQQDTVEQAAQPMKEPNQATQDAKGKKSKGKSKKQEPPPKPPAQERQQKTGRTVSLFVSLGFF